MLNYFFENLADCEMMWNNIVEPDRPQMANKATYMPDN